MSHNGIMTSLLSTVPQCQMPEFRKSSYSGARIALSLLLCQLLQHKQQLSLNAVKSVWCTNSCFCTQAYGSRQQRC